MNLVVSVQYQVQREAVYDAYYRLTDSRQQVGAASQYGRVWLWAGYGWAGLVWAHVSPWGWFGHMCRRVLASLSATFPSPLPLLCPRAPPNPTGQISAYVFDEVRAAVPKMSLDDTYELKDEIAKGIKDALAKSMSE